MDGAMGKEDDVVEAVLTCEGDFHDPELQNQIERFRHKLKDLLLTDSRKVQVRKVEPWNSVKVTLTIPKEAAVRLRQLAQNGSEALRQMGVLSVQVQGDSQIALTFMGSNNEHREVILSSSPAPQIPQSSAAGSAVQQQGSNPPPTEAVVSLDDLSSSPGPSSDEVTRKNIVDYLRQGPHLRQNAALIGSLMGTVSAVSSPSSSRHGISQDIPPVSNPATSAIGVKTHSYRPNNIATVGSAAVHYQGSQVAKNFPFKTTGAFHHPVPRHPISAGQSVAAIDSASSSTGSHQVQQHSTSIKSPIIQSAAIHQIPSSSGTSQNGLASSGNNFSPLGTHIHSSGLNNSNFITSAPAIPSSSSSSNYFADLPPPPPYPHGSSSAASSRANKPGNASSPMLVNLLQTDPSVAAAGMASGNPNKPLTIGESDSPPKKKRKRKQKAGTAKPSNELATGQNNFQPSPSIPQNMDSNSNPMRIEKTTIAADIQKPINTKLDSAATFGFFKDNKVSLAPSYPLKDNHRDVFSSSGVQSDLVKSAIIARTNSSLLLESNRPPPQQQQADIFQSESGAGKIINPYTGQLEPRDLAVDSSLPGRKDPGVTQGSSYFATQMLARRALELDEIAQKSVPQSSALLENVSSSTLNLVSLTSTITAAASTVNSDELSQSSDKKSPRLDPSSSQVTATLKGSLTQPSVYAGSTILPTTEPQTLQNIAKTAASFGISNGPLAGHRDTGNQRAVALSETNNKLLAPGANPSSSDSVIYSNVRVCLCSPTSQATFSQAPMIQSQVGSLRNQVRIAPVSSSHSSLSLSVSLDIPSAQTRLSSVSMAEQTKPSISDHTSFTHHRQAAIPNTDSKVPCSTPVTSPSLLNSVPEKHIDSISSSESPPETKLLSEGYENSDQSGLVADSGQEHSGTAALIEHSRVKIENHDSGIGSSSERSDDTPSEPGDGEFRTGHPTTEAEEGTGNIKLSLSQKLVDCKPDPPLVSVNNSITVGYMINSSGDSGKSPSSMKGTAKKPAVVPFSSVESSGSDISKFYDAHCKSMEKQAGLMSVEQVSLSSKWSEKGGVGFQSQRSIIKENGPTTSSSMESRTSPKLNGPSSQGSLNSMMATMSELHTKKMKLSPKQGGLNIKGTSDPPKEEQQIKDTVLEKLNRIHQQLQDQKESLSLSPSILQDIKSSEVIADKSQRDMSLAHRLEGHTEQLFLDLEEMQMKMMGNGTSLMAGGGTSAEGKGGNITSIYSKRSSPVNVNMLNHIYASGLPLPRRLTESVQRLVKPLPAPEMGISLSLPQSRAYNSKSPVSSNTGILSKAGATVLSSTNGPHHPTRMANHSGARSPGASMPRLIPNDQHRLLSGGLDLAGLSSFQMPSVHGADSVSLGGGTVGIGNQIPALSSHGVREDFALKGDPHSLTMKLHSSPNLLRDSQPYSSRMLSQSYPPFKTKDHLTSVVQRKHDIQISLDSSKVNEVVRSVSDPQVEGNLQFSAYNNHSYVESKESKLLNKHVGEETDINHSNKHTDASETHKFTYSSCSSSNLSTVTHSNVSSPLMPILQRGQEPPITPTFPSNMPSISSQPPLISLATTTEISSQEGTAGKPSTASASINQLQSVPCSNSLTTISVNIKANIDNAAGNGNASVMETQASRIPILSPVVGLTDSSKSPTKSSVESLQDHGASDKSDPPKLIKALAVPPVASVSPKAGSGTHNYQLNRNIFDTVSAESLPKQKSATTSLDSKVASIDPEGKLDSKDKKLKTCDSSLPEQSRVIDHVVELGNNSAANSLEPVHKNYSENGSKQHSSVTQNLPESESSKSLKPIQLLSTSVLSNTSEPKTIVSDSENLSEPTHVKDSSELEMVATSSLPHSSSESSQVSVSATITLVTGSTPLSNISLPSTSFVSSSGLSGTTCKPQEATSTPGSSLSVPHDSSSSTVPSVFDNGDSTCQSVADGGDLPSSTSPVKEPILETLASALRQHYEPPSQGSLDSLAHHNKVLEKSPTHQRPPMVPLTASDISKLEQSMMLQGRMVAVQSSTSTSIKTSAAEPSSCADAVSGNSRVTRKRKRNSSEGESHDSEGSTTSTRATSQKHAILGSNSKSKPLESPLNRTEKSSVKEAALVDSGPIHTKMMVSNSSERNEIIKANIELKDTAAKISADLEKSQERRRHRSITSSSQSDDGHSHCSSSNESRDSTSPSHRDGRGNKSVGLSTPDKDGRSHRSIGNTPGQHRETKFQHRAHPGFEKDGQSKENRSYRVPGHHSSEDTRHTLVDWSEDRSSGEEKDKLKLAGAKVLTPGEKFSSPDGKDDGQKKVQRVRRQFYAYVPEKSLDQTYFDTPILSGRTRSKNKPSEEETAAGTGTTLTTSSGDPHAPSPVTHNAASSTSPMVTGQPATQGKHAGDPGAAAPLEAGGSSGKRSMRSVRTKDTSQEQNPNKRRKVQQQR